MILNYKYYTIDISPGNSESGQSVWGYLSTTFASAVAGVIEWSI